MRVKRLDPLERRQQIVASAREAIADRGLAAMSLRDIARAAGVSMGTVTYHFASIDAILEELVLGESERFYADVVARADVTEDPDAALRLLIEPLFVDSDETRRHWRIWSDYWGIVARRPDVAAAYAERIRTWEGCCARIVARGVAEGRYVAVDPQAAALKLAAYADGLAMQLAQGADGLKPSMGLRWMVEFAALMLGAPSPDGSPAGQDPEA